MFLDNIAVSPRRRGWVLTCLIAACKTFLRDCGAQRYHLHMNEVMEQNLTWYPGRLVLLKQIVALKMGPRGSIPRRRWFEWECPMAKDEVQQAPVAIRMGGQDTYFAVLFTAQRTISDENMYQITADRMVTLAQQQPGFLGVEFPVRGDDGDVVSRCPIGGTARQSATGGSI